MSRLSRIVALAPLLALSTTVAHAADLTIDETHPQIFGGQEVNACAWPSAVYLSGSGAACTGALIHPEIVLTAAHCVEGDVTMNVGFGDVDAAAHTKADTEYCRAFPGWTGQLGEGTDYGFCKLAEPVTDVPIIPVLYGCERGVLGVGQQIVHVGFGVDQAGTSGRKKELWTTIDTITSGEILTGGGGDAICSGDSGGPTFIRLPTSVGGDNTWRVAAIHSWSQMPCGGQGGSVIADQAVPWIEQESGVDITPCFTTSGDWDPTWGCQAFPTSPQSGGGSHLTGCELGDPIGFSQVCGEPLDANPDVVPPSVSLVAPSGPIQVDFNGMNEAVHVEANADDGDGWGLDYVELVVADAETEEEFTQADDRDPFTWDAAFPPGAYFLKVRAFDYAGNEAETEWVPVGVNQPPPETPAPGEDDGGSGDDGGAGTGGGDGGDGNADGGGDGDGGGAQDSGCGCRHDAAPGGGAAWAVVLIGAGLLRRRRR